MLLLTLFTLQVWNRKDRRRGEHIMEGVFAEGQSRRKSNNIKGEVDERTDWEKKVIKLGRGGEESRRMLYHHSIYADV